MKEIGSEFWKVDNQHIKHNETIFLSGRTALDAIVRDAVVTYGITAVLLPSYCCHTMIEPFLSNGIRVRFYDVYVADDGILTAEIPSPGINEMLYIMKYFGDTGMRYEGEGNQASEWVVSVEDLTHSCFSAEYSSQADYWFASYRKWFAVDGIALAGKRNGKLSEPGRGQNIAYSFIRNQAFSMKQEFMDGKPVKKNGFLDMFKRAEKLLGEDYSDFRSGYEAVYDLFRFMDEIEGIRLKRRANARTLIEKLSGTESIKVFTDFRDDRKCPLFVPVLVEDGMRDSLRKFLISKDVYCPVHWPLSNQHTGISERAVKLYGQELSLVCDQRYDEDDMERTVALIREFLVS